MSSRFPPARLALLMATALVSSTAVYAATVSPSLCVANEEVLFTCPVGAKLLSICASRDLSRTSGSLYYRFGVSGKPELVYPSSPRHPSQSFSAFFNSWAKGNEVQLSFPRGPLTYTVFAYQSSFSGTGHGVAIYRAEKRIAKLNCLEDVVHRLHELSDYAIPETERRDVP